MRRSPGNLFSKYAFIVVLTVALLSGQVFRQHLHIQHDGIASFKNEGRIVATQVNPHQHNTTYNVHHLDDLQSPHHSTEVDVSFDSFVKKVGQLIIFVVLLFIAGGVLYIPRFLRLQGRYIFKTKLTFFYNLLQPPLRAPPGISFL